MIHFNELRYSCNNKILIIDTEIDNIDYYDNVIIDSIVIDNQNTYIANGPSSSPIFTYSTSDISEYLKTYAFPEECPCNPVLEGDEYSYCFTYGLDNKKHVRLELKLNTLDVDPCNDMLFVYVIASGTPSSDTPCGFDNSKIMRTVINLKGIYDCMLSYIRQIEHDCIIPKDFIDSILRFKALEVAIRTGNYPLAIKYWKRFYQDNLKSTQLTTNCGCYG